jgi:LacI family transcriptional regulator
MNARRNPAPTIMDVARHAQVSMKTDSRVLNNEPNVVPAMQERVMASVRALGYKPNLHARSLARSRSSLLGLLYYASSANFVMGLQRGATARCRALGYHLVVEQLDDSGAQMQAQLQHMLTALRPDGLILAPPACDSREVLQMLADAHTPCVRISPGFKQTGLGCVSIDDHHAAEAMTAALLALGHRRIGYITGNPGQIAAPRRLAGHRAALQAHGVPLDDRLVVTGDFTFPSGLAGGAQLLAVEPRPTAIIAANDDMALGAMAAAQQQGLRVPQDVSIAGFDDGPLASLVWPRLSTVRQPVVEMAEAAVDLLVSRPTPPGKRPGAGDDAALALLDDANADLVLPYELVLRDSTARPG